MNQTVTKTRTVTLNEYRCTRRKPYVGTPAATDATQRQGHYIIAASASAAAIEMAQRFPGETDFDIVLWKETLYSYTSLTLE